MSPTVSPRRLQTPTTTRVRVEVPRGSFGKRDATGTLEYPSPVPCPFNYGSAVGTRSADGEEADVVVLGPRLPLGSERELPVRAVVVFDDDGLPDDKWVCSAAPLRRRDRVALWAFFAGYGLVKRWSGPLRGATGSTGFRGLHDLPSPKTAPA